MQHIEPFHVMKLLARARELEAQGRDIIHMEIGEPDFISPEPILHAAQAALAAGKTHYTPATGLVELRQSISCFYLSQYNLDIPPSRVIITAGASAALLLVLGALVGPGDKVMMTDPGYPCNKHFTRFMQAEPISVAVSATTDFQLTLALVDKYWQPQVRVVLIASPSNPCGTLIDEQELRSIAAYVEQKNAVLIVDEIYHGLCYATQPQTALALSPQIFVINSFSKYYTMTGWRLGWLVAPPQALDALDRLAQNLFLAAPTVAQYAALAAFDSDTQTILQQQRKEFVQRRDYLLPALKKLGFTISVEPQGAFYIYANCSSFTNDSFLFVEQLLERAGVAITPGKDFGQYRSKQHVRFAYTTSLSRLQLAIERMTDYL